MMVNFRYVLKTLFFIAATIMLQRLNPLISFSPLGAMLVTDSMVNTSLALSSIFVGAWSGIAVSIAVPVAAFFHQYIRYVWLIPIIAGGNITLVLVYRWLYRRHKWICIFSAALAKFAVTFPLIYVCVRILVIDQQQTDMLRLLFGWPQFAAGVTGGVLLLFLLKWIPKK